MAAKNLPLGNKAGMANAPGARRFFAQQFPLRPHRTGAAQGGASAVQPIAASAFQRFNSQFRVVPSIPQNFAPVHGPATLPTATPKRMQQLRKQMRQANKSGRGRR